MRRSPPALINDSPPTRRGALRAPAFVGKVTLPLKLSYHHFVVLIVFFENALRFSSKISSLDRGRRGLYRYPQRRATAGARYPLRRLCEAAQIKKQAGKFNLLAFAFILLPEPRQASLYKALHRGERAFPLPWLPPSAVP